MTDEPGAGPRELLAGAGLAIAVGAVGLWLVPALIRLAYVGEAPAFLNRLISGQAAHPVERYLTDWRGLFYPLWMILLVGIAVRSARHGPRLQRLRRAISGGGVWSARAVVLFAVWAGVLTGAWEGIYAAGRHLIEHHASRPFQWESTWMAPLAGGLFFGLAALLAVVTLRALGLADARGFRPKGVACAVAFVAAVGVLAEPTFGLASYAVPILAAGLSASVARVVTRDPRRVLRFARRSVPALAAALSIATAVGIWNLPALAEARRARSLPDANPDAPNIVLIILDTVRASNLGLYGYGRPTTPFLDAWATTGAVFESAISTAPWTLPSHASLFTGRWAHDLNVSVGVGLDGEHATLAEVLAEHGYRSGGFVANLANTSESAGLARGFTRYEDYPLTPGRFVVSTWLGREVANRIPGFRDRFRLGRKAARDNSDDAIAWIRSVPPEQPYFVFLNYMEAHAPYIAPPRFRKRFPSDRPVIQPEDGVGMTPAELDGTRAAYDAAIAYLDAELGRLIRAASEEGYDERPTLVILSADHGEFFGEHRLVEHGGALFEPVVHVPLVVVLPGAVPAGVRIATPVSIRDIPATIIDLATGSRDARLGGRSLSRYWTGIDADSAAVLAEITSDRFEWPGQTDHDRSVFFGRLHYIRLLDGSDELFDLRSDPREHTSLTQDPGKAEALRRARAEMARLLDGDP